MYGQVAKQLSLALNTLMKERDLSITALHKRTGISRETLYRIRRAESLPTTDILLRLASELRVSPGSLLDNALGGAGRAARGTLVQSELTSALQAIESRLGHIEQLIAPSSKKKI